MRSIGKRVILITAFATATVWSSVSVNWASDIHASNEDSEGQALTSDLIFELGSFGSGFVESDKSTWAGAWKALDRVRYHEDDSAFGKTTVFSQNSSDFAIGQRAYIWGFRPSGPVSEWILISDPSWTWPNATSPLSFPRNWLVASATESLVGMINSSGNQMKTEAITEATPLIPWPSWLAISFDESELSDPLSSGPLADPDQDGLANQLEYFLGGHPKVKNPSIFKLAVTVVGEEEHIEVNFSPSADLTPQLLQSANLLSWQEVTSVMPQNPRSPFQMSWVRLTGEASRSFFQLQVSVPE
jgi:hypothetical protein